MDEMIHELHKGRVYEGGYYTYGRGLGVMVLDTKFPRIVGDVGNARTYDFPVLFEVVEGASADRVIEEQDPELLDPFVEAARKLVDKGAVAITTSCGFLLMFQDELAERVDDVPIFSSSLLQIPIAKAMAAPGQQIGILTANENHFERLDHPVVTENREQLVVEGMAESTPWQELIFTEERGLDYDEISAEVVDAVRRILEREPNIGSLVVEGTNFHPYAFAIQQEMNIPVYTYFTLANMVWHGCKGTRF